MLCCIIAAQPAAFGGAVTRELALMRNNISRYLDIVKHICCINAEKEILYRKTGDKMARPRSTSLPPDDMIALGKEMIEWVRKNKPTRLSQWYTQVKHILYQDWRVWRERPEFAPYYEEAIDLCAERYIDGTIDKAIAQRFLRIYFKELKNEEDETARYHSELKQKEAQQVSQEDIERAKAILDQISRNQSDARKMEDTKIKAESKS